MTLRFALSRLERPEARRAFGRTWLWLCLAGAGATLVADNGRHFFLVLVAWLVCVFAPVRIAVETLHTAGPRWKASLQQRLRTRADRYASAEGITLMVEWFASSDVRPPRLVPPDLAPKVVAAAARLCERAMRTGGATDVLGTATRCASMLDRWVGTIAAGERGEPLRPPLSAAAASAAGNGAAPANLWDPRASIQDQWETLKAVAGLAALTKVLIAVSEDSAGRTLDGGAAIRAEADAAMDYVDQIGLRLDGPPWEDVPGLPRPPLPPDTLSRMTETWLTFCGGPLPAPQRLAAFVDAVTA
ncbi:MAG TPA: hypothetical protein VKW09_06945 [bacterium]|nr:hypothetical protein [bacterium]